MARPLRSHLRQGLVVLLLGAAVGALVLSFGFSFEWASRPLPYRHGQTTFPIPYHPSGRVFVVSIRGGSLRVTHTVPIDRMPQIMLPLGW